MTQTQYTKNLQGVLTLITLTLAIILVIFTLTGCKKTEKLELNGYIEAEPTLVASSQSGMLTHLKISKGDWVKANQALCVLEQENEIAQVSEAKAKYDRLVAILEDNLKGKRPEERAALQAELDSAKASLKLSEIELKRQTNLIQSGYTSKSNLDTLTAQRDKNLAHVKEISAQIELAQLGVRQDLLQASQEEANMAQAQLAQAQWRLDQKNLVFHAANKARVEDIFFRIGEWVPAGSPIIKLQTVEQIKARFFVPEALLPKIKLGQNITLSCDGCPKESNKSKALFAKISFISNRAEFTPPVIFSQQTRERLVFMVEATPPIDQAIQFKGGQPIQIQWEYIEQES
jgi:HlyD family secretion protein